VTSTKPRNDARVDLSDSAPVRFAVMLRSALPWLLVGGLSAAIVPWVYIAARNHAEGTRLEELIAKSRWGEANHLARRLLAASPETRVRGQPLATVAEALASRVRELEASAQTAPAASAPPGTHLAYARTLAMLGLEEQAIRHVEAAPFKTVEALNLLGTIHETRSNWLAAENHFRRAEKSAAHESTTPHRAAQIQALTGLAYAQRKQGRYPDAEQTYLQLWNLSPTADTAFLLAQFYEDTQQTQPAERFTRQAISLDPSRFTEPGRRLLNSLRTRQFGCFQLGWP